MWTWILASDHRRNAPWYGWRPAWADVCVALHRARSTTAWTAQFSLAGAALSHHLPASVRMCSLAVTCSLPSSLLHILCPVWTSGATRDEQAQQQRVPLRAFWRTRQRARAWGGGSGHSPRILVAAFAVPGVARYPHRTACRCALLGCRSPAWLPGLLFSMPPLARHAAAPAPAATLSLAWRAATTGGQTLLRLLATPCDMSVGGILIFLVPGPHWLFHYHRNLMGT